MRTIIIMLLVLGLVLTACGTNGLTKEPAPLCQQSGGTWNGERCTCPQGMNFTPDDGCTKTPA